MNCDRALYATPAFQREPTVAPLSALFGEDAAVLEHREFQLVLLVTVPTLLGTTVLSPVLDSLIDPFGTTTANVGLLISAFTGPAILIIPLAGAVADRIGRKPVLVSSLLLFGTAGSAIAFTTDFRVALGLRLLQGAAFAGLNPILITTVRDIFKGSAEATGQGLRVMVAGFGQTVFAPIAGLLVVVAWQLPFLLYAMAFPIALAVFVWFEEPTETDAVDTGADAGYTAELLALLARRRVIALLVARGLVLVVWFGFLTYNSIVVVRLLDGSPGQAGALVAVGSLSYALAASQAGRVTAAFDSRLYPLLGGNCILGIGLAVFAFAPGLFVAAVGVAASSVGFGMTLSLYRSAITGLAPVRLRAGLVSVAEAGGRLVATLTPIAMGAAMTGLTPSLGFESAVRSVVGGAGLLTFAVTTICVVIAAAAASDAVEDTTDA